MRLEKVVAALPTALTADTAYFVRVGTGYDFYMTDSTGAVAHTLNLPAGDNVTITVAADQAAYDAATPGPLELVVLNA